MAIINQGRSVERVGIAGFGTIGREIAHRIQSQTDDYSVSAVSANNLARANDYIKRQKWEFPAVGIAELAERADLVVESAPATIFREIAEPVLRAGKTLVAL